MTKFTRRVNTPKEYKEMVEHAESLGFEVCETYGAGNWDAEGAPAWPKKCKIEKVGRKYFHIPMYSEYGMKTFKCTPGTSTATGNDGYLRVTFSDEHRS